MEDEYYIDVPLLLCKGRETGAPDRFGPFSRKPARDWSEPGVWIVLL